MDEKLSGISHTHTSEVLTEQFERQIGCNEEQRFGRSKAILPKAAYTSKLKPVIWRAIA